MGCSSKMPVQKYTAEERGQRGTGSYKVNICKEIFVLPRSNSSTYASLCRFSWKMPLGQSPLSMISHTKPPTQPSMLSSRFPGGWWSTSSVGLDECLDPILWFLCFARWTNAKMEVDTKAPLHPIVQVTNFLHDSRVREAVVNISFAGYKERETAVCCQLFPSPWLHLELWGHSSGSYPLQNIAGYPIFWLPLWSPDMGEPWSHRCCHRLQGVLANEFKILIQYFYLPGW